VCLLIFVTSCTNESDFDLNNSNTHTEDYFVNIKYVKNLVQNIKVSGLENSKGVFENINKEIDTIYEVPDKNSITAYYIINFKEKGFFILSADKRVEPFLAYSSDNSIYLDSQEYPSGLISWLHFQKTNVEFIRDKNGKATDFIKHLWNEADNGSLAKVLYVGYEDGGTGGEGGNPYCDPYMVKKEPLISTKWGQGCTYNSQTPAMSCNQCGNAWTGCVATAMAQVMRYHEHPTNYNWSSMPNNSGNFNVATLMRNIGDAVNMGWGCDVSSANVEDDAISAFHQNFNYSSATYDDYNYQVVKSQLGMNKPVILCGGTNTGWWIFPDYEDGHAWLTDGYRNLIYPCYGSYLHFHMNWGWENQFDGWFSFNDFNSGNGSFNYERGMIYNINP
jgi:hypothetical protein